MKKKISFEDSHFAPVEVPDQACLSEHLTVQNSPILFGCRIGICGTCLIDIKSDPNLLLPRTETESEFLEALMPGNLSVRLACQININCDLRIQKAKI